MITVQILNPITHNKIGLRHAERLVRLRRAKWARGTSGMAVWLIREQDLSNRPSVDAGGLLVARDRELAGVPVVQGGRLLGRGLRTAGPAYRG